MVALHGREGGAEREPGLTMTDPLEDSDSDRPEAERLERGLGRLELVRTRDYLDEALPKRERILQLSRAAEDVRELLAASPHAAVIAQRG